MVTAVTVTSPLKCYTDVGDLALVSNFWHVLNVVFSLLGESPASEFYVPTFRITLFHLNRCKHHL